MSNPTCKTCPYFDNSRAMRANYGVCRRYAPGRSVTISEDGEMNAWQSVDESEWCGEHPMLNEVKKCESVI